jgi:plasmid replication initiation protein
VPGRQNLVQPSHVGRRVSFQYELPNGYVGEAVGVLEAWDEAANTYLVRNRAGELVRVPALGVRFGKVIPG